MASRAAASPGTRRFRLASPKTVLVVLGCLVLVLGAAFVPFARLSHQSLTGNGGGTPFWTFLPFGVVGFVVAWRRPRNRLGWILVGLAVAGAFSEDGSLYAIADYRLRHGTLSRTSRSSLGYEPYDARLAISGSLQSSPERQQGAAMMRGQRRERFYRPPRLKSVSAM